MKMSDYPDDDMGRFPGAGTFRIDFNALKEPKEPTVTIPRAAAERALARLDRIGLYQCNDQDDFDETCRAREALRSALGET